MDKILLHDAEQIFDSQPKLIEFPKEGYAVFVGDTHGDLEATETVLDRYLPDNDYTLVFLGDYVDRGPSSMDNIDTLLKAKADHPNRLYLLQGNHEAPEMLGSPREFWDSLSPDERIIYGRVLGKLPYAALGRGLIGLHGGLPDVESMQDMGSIKPGSDNWERITWGDFRAFSKGDYLGISNHGRPEFGMAYFNRVMKKLGKNVLIRSHQPGAAGTMYNNRCLTLFTSKAYLPERTIAVTDLGKEAKSANDLDVRKVLGKSGGTIFKFSSPER